MRASASCSKALMSKAVRDRAWRRRLQMDVEIDQRRGDVFHRRAALVEGARGDEAAQQILRDRLAGAEVDGEAAEDFRPLQPMLVELRRQFHPVREHAGARDHGIGDVGEERVQRVAEFVEQRPGIVERQQRRLAFAGLGKIHDVDDQRPDIAAELFLVAQRGHPGAAVLRAAREIVAEEEPAMAPGGIAHLPYPHVVVPDRDARRGVRRSGRTGGWRCRTPPR